MTVLLDGHSLTIENVVRIAREGEKVEIHRNAANRIRKCRELLEKKTRSKELIYGVNTGVGEMADVVLTPEQAEDFQRYLIYSHSAGCGEPAPEDAIRAGMLSRINSQCWGHSGVRFEITEAMKDMLNKGVNPVVCQRGSVGACGDLAPMAQMALVLMGEGEAFYRGKRVPGGQAMKKAGIPTTKFKERDGLATINGSNLITGMGCLSVFDAGVLVKTNEIALAMTLESLKANRAPFDPRVHLVRGFPGAQDSAENIRTITAGSELMLKPNRKVQDAYSLRSSPQVLGTARDVLTWARYMLETELNHAADNPTFFPDEDAVLTGANFQGTPMAITLETVGTAMTTISVLAERRVNRLLNPALSAGLPAFLTKGAGMFSGLMLTQYTAGALLAESRVLSTPAATLSVPAAADQEDFVSMGMTTAIKTRRIIENSTFVTAIELIAAAQALDLRKPAKPSKGGRAALEAVRKVVPTVEEDRPFFKDINALAAACKDGAILKAVEKAVGRLK